MTPDNALDQLIALATSPGDTGRVYRLVDPQYVPERRLSPEQRETSGLIRNPFLAQTWREKLYLQPLDMTEQALRHRVQEERAQLPRQSDGPIAHCGWVVSNHPISTLARHLERQLVQVTPEGKRSLLRFFAPRVLERLVELLDSRQLSRLLGPIDHWFYFDSRHRLRQLSPHTETRHIGRVQLTQEQWRLLRRMPSINTYLRAWHHMVGDDRAPPSLLDVDRLISAAQELGIEREKDILIFVLHGLLFTVDFYQHPEIRQRLARIRPNLSYEELTNDMEDDDWARIDRELKERRHVT
ncbi:DUF4123 domain-containing protein [Salinicola sp. DM10]|uniref:DUF4123 domain-containing protein n=1 Tax=Salinicola sp. DM10 TaxID=2815721 RepID=UPI001A8CDEF7|nr:DUF4123 domain-containing protein [Salinicola sp. DM10]MCE3027507.1 DUF4123 domain-containing protein [Salinicola sp. DM10]